MVLVVDDEQDIRQAVSEILVEEGHEVIDAGDGVEALKKLRAFHPGLVLLDFMMPGMNGWEFRRQQQGDPDVSEIPVVVLSAFMPGEAVDAAGFIQKPFDLSELVSAVTRYAH